MTSYIFHESISILGISRGRKNILFIKVEKLSMMIRSGLNIDSSAKEQKYLVNSGYLLAKGPEKAPKIRPTRFVIPSFKKDEKKDATNYCEIIFCKLLRKLYAKRFEM